MSDKVNYAVRPDAQPFDEIKIKIVPRFKESNLSGNEWRISTVTEFYRKGKIVHTTSCCGKIEVAAGMLYGNLVIAQDKGKGFFAGDGFHCDQEGCPENATVLLKLKKEYCVGGGNCGAEKKQYSDKHRCFCDKHKKRGNQDREDCDENYEFVKTL